MISLRMVNLIIQEWLAPDLKKQLDGAELQVHDLYSKLVQVEGQAALLFMENQKLKSQVAAAVRPETPRILRAATSAEVRKMTEQAFFEEKDESN